MSSLSYTLARSFLWIRKSRRSLIKELDEFSLLSCSFQRNDGAARDEQWAGERGLAAARQELIPLIDMPICKLVTSTIA